MGRRRSLRAPAGRGSRSGRRGSRRRPSGCRSRSASRCSCSARRWPPRSCADSARTGAPATTRSSTSGSLRSDFRQHWSRSPARATCAASVLARVGDAALGAHQIAFQLFIFLALVLDAIAIAGQVIVGRSLGAGDAHGAYEAAARMIASSVAIGAAFAVVLLALTDWTPRAFTDDPEVIHDAKLIWPLFALMQPLGGAVFALDGILIGASDTAFLAWSMMAASAVFLTIALLSLHLQWGIVGLWVGLDVLIAARLALLGARFRGRRWA